MDSLTMHYVARELGDRWRGHRIVGSRADRVSRTLTLSCEGSPSVVFDLRGLVVREVDEQPSGELMRGWTIVGVEAPVDERRLIVRCERPGKFRGSPSKHGEIEVSFIPSARAVRVRDGRQPLVAIGAAPPPLSEPRPALDESTIRHALEARDDATILRGRWMSPAVCDALLASRERAVERYRLILSLPAAEPVRCGDAVFPLPLCDGERVASLIASATRSEVPATAATDRTSRAIARMRRELERARQAPRLRAVADALMALGAEGEVPEKIVLADGSEAVVPASDDRRDTPVALAERLYKEVRAMERAAERLPARIAALEAAPTVERAVAKPRSVSKRSDDRQRRPYKSYRSSGGIDILVGRGARANEELTFDIARPDDVWLHARDVTGAHVVMRWTAEGPPPARDLREAAALAAWYSRARGSVVVPVDWTRRRHVRRARGGAPGRVLVERVQTVMARPTAELERRLRNETGLRTEE